MSIFIQTGHRSSYSDVIMQKLYERGLYQPCNSFTHNMSSQQVSNKLYEIIICENTSTVKDKLTDNVMVDLLLSNLDNLNWGWTAEKNLFSMDLWQEMEPEVNFILVFDHPSILLNHLMAKNITIDLIDEAVYEWIEYHQKMLEIFEKYEDQVLLIEGRCAIENISNLGKYLSLISSSLHLKSHWQISHVNTDSTVSHTNDYLKLSDVATEYINSEILKKYPEIIRLFNALLHKAIIKSSKPIYRTKKSELPDLIAVSNYLYNQKEYTNSLTEKNLLIEQQLLVYEKCEQQTINSNQSLKNEIKELSFILDEKQEYILQSESRIKKLEKEVNSLCKVEKTNDDKSLIKNISSQNKEFLAFSNKIHEKRAKNSSEKINKKIFGAGIRFKNSKEYIVGRTIIDVCNSPKKLFELKKIYKETSQIIESENSKSRNLPDLILYEDFHEIEKFKKHLSYKIGNEIFSTRKSKFFKLPVILIKHAVLHKKNNEERL